MSSIETDGIIVDMKMETDAGYRVTITRESHGFRWILQRTIGTKRKILQGANPHSELDGCLSELSEFTKSVLDQDAPHLLRGKVWEQCPAEDSVDLGILEAQVARSFQDINRSIEVIGEGVKTDLRAMYTWQIKSS